MEDAGGGGGYGGTDWMSRNVREMWATVEGQQTDPHWKLVSGWRRTFELTSMHLSRLQEYRRRLAEAWPPERSAASAAYVGHLDYLITHVQQTYDAAVANYDAFSGATGALSTTRHQLDTIRQEYEANETKLAGWQQDVDEWRQTPAAPKAGKPPAPKSPVASGRQEELNNQARSLMYQLSSELTQARAAIRQPPPYVPPKAGVQDGNPDAFGGGGAPVAPPPPFIPPPVAPPSPPAAGSPAQVQGVVGPTTGGGPGPTLGGTGTLPAPAPGTVNPGLPAPPPVAPTPPPGGGVIGPPLPPAPAPIARPPAGGVIGTPTPPPKPVGGNATALPRPMPPGGVIGPIAQPVAGQPAGGRATAPRVNPVGGVIGQPPTGRPAGGVPAAGTPAVGAPAPGGRGAGGVAPGQTGRGPVSGAAPAPGGRASGPTAGPRGAATPGAANAFGAAPGGRTGRRDEEERPGRTWDPDNPWETDAGVDPVVLPPRAAGRVDPGPAIGSDR